MQKQQHWETVYQKKNFEEVSWFQETPTTSISFFESMNLSKSAKIIDIGGGESRFIDYLLANGYQDVSVLDISATAIEKKKQALGEKAQSVTWIVSDVVDFKPTEQYDFWHDRATFHFLTQKEDVETYIQTISQHIKPEGSLIISTFSENGPEKCSGLPIQQYSEKTLSERVEVFFTKIKCVLIDHITPFATVQNFIFCSFKRKKELSY
ncbi:MAG: class I SAM-dependent methyltransferase [Saprospiraceae bacterium]|nr:class I SAM-dependent methyltransferase [Saprospiraceae bacterium]